MTTCKAITKKGKPCQANPLASGFCLIHSAPGKAAELGRKGGRGNRHTQAAGDVTPLEPPRCAAEIRTVLADLMADVKNGLVDPKTANCVAYISTSLLKAIEVVEISDRLERLELLSKKTK